MSTGLEDIYLNWQRMSAFRREATLVCLAIGLVTCVVLLWVFFAHKRRKRHSRHHGHQHTPAWAAKAEETHVETPLAVPHRRKWRRRRRDHRPRNPTLAETGGLPPIRPEHTDDSAV